MSTRDIHVCARVVCVCTMGILVRLHTNQLWKHINRGYSQLTNTLNRGYPLLTIKIENKSYFMVYLHFAECCQDSKLRLHLSKHYQPIALTLDLQQLRYRR